MLDEPFNINKLDSTTDKAKCTSPGKDKICMKIIKQFPF